MHGKSRPNMAFNGGNLARPREDLPGRRLVYADLFEREDLVVAERPVQIEVIADVDKKSRSTFFSLPLRPVAIWSDIDRHHRKPGVNELNHPVDEIGMLELGIPERGKLKVSMSIYQGRTDDPVKLTDVSILCILHHVAEISDIGDYPVIHDNAHVAIYTAEAVDDESPAKDCSHSSNIYKNLQRFGACRTY